MFDDHDRIAAVCESVQDLHQLMHIREVQSGRRLVQDIDRPARASLGKLGCQLDSLRLTAGKRGGRLSQLHIGQAHIIQGLDFIADGGHMLEERQGLLHRHVQHIKNTLSLVFYFQSFTIVALTAADLTGNIHIRQEVHLDLDDSVTAAGLTATALDIEAEASLRISLCLGVGRGCKQVSDLVKHARVGRGVGTRRSSDGRLVDVNDLIQLLQTFDSAVLSGNTSRTV